MPIPLLTQDALSPIVPKSRNGSGRNPIERDIDALAFQPIFSALAGKLQVFGPHIQEIPNTRYTHSVQVSRIARTLGAKSAGTVFPPNEIDIGNIALVCEAAGLAHDIGAPPFAHTGENTIQEWFAQSGTGQELLSLLSSTRERMDFLSFEGNAIGFHLLAGKQYPRRQGVGLTAATLAVYTKYPVLSDAVDPKGPAPIRKHGIMACDEEIYRQVRRKCGFPDDAPPHARHPLAWLVEAADDIGYLVADILDGVRLGLLSNDAAFDALRMIVPDLDRQTEGALPIDHLDCVRSDVIHHLIERTLELYRQHLPAILDGTHSAPLVDEIDGIQDLRRFSYTALYTAPHRAERLFEADRALYAVLDAFGATALEILTGGARSNRARIMAHYRPDLFASLAGKSAYDAILAVLTQIVAFTDDQIVALGKKLQDRRAPLSGPAAPRYGL